MEELHEREGNCHNLQEYASLLLQRLIEHAPHLLDSILVPKWEELGRWERGVHRTHHFTKFVVSAQEYEWSGGVGVATPPSAGTEWEGSVEIPPSGGSVVTPPPVGNGR